LSFLEHNTLARSHCYATVFVILHISDFVCGHIYLLWLWLDQEHLQVKVKPCSELSYRLVKWFLTSVDRQTFQK